jgi:hypothetical protein
MTGTVTISESGKSIDRPINCLRFAWTSDASGNASASRDFVSGQIVRAVFIPGSGGVQPTNAYDITITDDDSRDVLQAQGADLSNSAASEVSPGTPLKDGTTTSVVPKAVCGALTLNVSNAGNAKSGTVVLYLR